MKKYSKLMAVLLVVAMLLPGIAQAAPVTETGVEVTRLGGLDRVGTSVLASQAAYDKADAVVLAGFGGDVDALTGTLLASAKDAPLLITRKAELTKEAADEIARLEAKTVYILGGETVVSAAVQTELEKKYTVKRIAGDNREETAIAVAKEVKGTEATHVFLTLGRMPVPTDALADALAIGPVSAMKNMPVLLTGTKAIPASTAKAMKDMGVTHVTIIGGPAAVSANVATELAKDYTVNRVAGEGREDTALEIAAEYFATPTNYIVAYGRSSADALVGGYLGAMKNAPILLTNNAGLTEATKAKLAANPLDTYILGGPTVITKTVEDQVVEALGGEVEEPEVELEVESVSAITETGVDVTFAELEVDLDDATVLVKNSKDETVAVKTVNLKKGDKATSFDFETVVGKSDLTGTWTVDGVEFDFDEKEKVEDIVKRAKGNSAVLFVRALENADITDIDEDVADGYKTAVVEADPAPTTFAEVQAIVDGVNEEYSKVKAVIDAAMSPLGKELKVFNALKDGFEGVEADFSEEYMKAAVKQANETPTSIGSLNYSNYTGSEGVTYKEIQDGLNRVNFYKTAEAVNQLWDRAKAPTASEISKARNLVDKYSDLAYQEDNEFTAGQYLEDAMTEIELMVNVEKASTKGSVKAAIEKLEAFDAKLPAKYVGIGDVTFVAPYKLEANDAFGAVTALEKGTFRVQADNQVAQFEANEDYKYVQANAEAYMDKFSKTEWANRNSRSEIVGLIVTTNVEESNTAIADLVEKAGEDLTDPAKRAEFLKSLNAVGAKRVASSNNDIYVNNKVKTLIIALDADTDTIEEVQKIVDAANIEAVKTASSATKLERALRVLEIKKLDIISENKAFYLTEIGKAIITGGADENGVTAIDADTTAITNAVKTGNKAAKIQALVEDINDATTAEQVKTALDGLNLDDYVATPSADRIFLAGEMLANRNLLTKDRTVVESNGTTAATLTPGKLQVANEFYNVGELEAYLTVELSEANVNIDFNKDGDKTDTDEYTSPVTKRTNILDGSTGVNSIAHNRPDTDSAADYTKLIKETAELFKGLELPGFKDDTIITSAESAKAEAFLDSDAFYTVQEAADLDGVDAGDLKRPFRNIVDVLVYFN